MPEYIAGSYLSLLIHESGHAAVGAYYGASDIRIEIPRKGAGFYSGATYYRADSVLLKDARFRRNVSLSGLVAANLAGEMVIGNPSLRENKIAQGVLSTALMSYLVHVAKHYIGYRPADGLRNDIDSYKASGGNAHVLSAILIGYTAWTLKRMSDKAIPLFGVDLRF